METAQNLQTGRVVASFGRHFLVESERSDGQIQRTLCHPRGKKSEAVVGDSVLWLPSGDEGRIEKIEPRRNLLWRQDELRSKSFAANIDQALILLAAEPEFSEQQLARALIACEAAQIAPLIVLNKRDLTASFDLAWARLAPYRAVYPQVLSLSLKFDLDADRESLLKMLGGKSTLILGPSGVGKSSLVNALVPQAQIHTQEISHALNSGKHTTTASTWYWLDATRSTALIDSPGFQEFGLHHIAATDLARYMPDFAKHLGKCRFYNCTHRHEPGCELISHIKNNENLGGISASRYEIYSRLFVQLSGG